MKTLANDVLAGTIPAYRDHVVALTDRCRFAIDQGALADEYRGREFSTYQDLCDFVDKQISARISRDRAEKAKTWSIDVLNGVGARAKIGGLHRTRNRVLGVPECEFNADKLFPPVDSIARLIEEDRAIATRRAQIERELRPFVIARDRRYSHVGGTIDGDAYTDEMEHLAAEVRRKTEAARRHFGEPEGMPCDTTTGDGETPSRQA